MTEPKKLIEIDYPTKLIKLEDQWYIRVGPVCWFLKTDIGYETMIYTEAVEVEERYQILIPKNERREISRNPICWYYNPEVEKWCPMTSTSIRRVKGDVPLPIY